MSVSPSWGAKPRACPSDPGGLQAQPEGHDRERFQHWNKIFDPPATKPRARPPQPRSEGLGGPVLASVPGTVIPGQHADLGYRYSVPVPMPGSYFLLPPTVPT